MNTNRRIFIQKVTSVVCAVLVAFFSIFYCVSIPVFAADDWAALGDDVVALKDSYLKYLNGWGNGSLTDIIGGAVDVPVSWYKILSDGTKAISPVDDWAYYLTEDDQSGGGGGHVRTGDSSSHASDRPSSEVAPVLPSETLKQAASYWADYYKPMPTTTQYVFSYQTTESDSGKAYRINLPIPVYLDAFGSWGKKNWSGVYILPFVEDDNNYYYNKSYIYFYSSKEDGDVFLHYDFYDLESGSLLSEHYLDWDISSTPFVGFELDTSGSTSDEAYIRFYSSYANYMTASLNYSHTIFLDYMIASDYSTSSANWRNLVQSVSFTPDTNSNDDFGVYLSADPFQLFRTQTSIDFEQIPDNYTITINGDNFYDYSITNPATGDTSTINEYVTNNYTYITNNGDDSGGGSSSSSGDVSVGGNVNVSGNVNVGGQIDINTNPIDININVNSGSSGSGSFGTGEVSQPYVNGEDVNLNEYLEHVPEISKGFTDYLQEFFAWLPKEIYGLLILALVVCIWCRLAGR